MLRRLRDIAGRHWPHLALGLLAVAAFFSGRASAPSRVVEREVTLGAIVLQETRQEGRAQLEERVQTRVVERVRIVYADGTQLEREVEASGSAEERAEVEHVDVQVETEQLELADHSRETTPAPPGWRIGPLAAVNVLRLGEQQLLGPVALGAQLHTPPLGPLAGTVFALSSGHVGLGFTVQF